MLDELGGAVSTRTYRIVAVQMSKVRDGQIVAEPLVPALYGQQGTHKLSKTVLEQDNRQAKDVVSRSVLRDVLQKEQFDTAPVSDRRSQNRPRIR